MINRERKVDITKLSEEQLQALEVQLGEKVRQICDEACEKANKLLNIYGLYTQMQIVIDHEELKKRAKKSSSKKEAKQKPDSQSLS